VCSYYCHVWVLFLPANCVYFLYFNGILHVISSSSKSYLCKGKHAFFSHREFCSEAQFVRLIHCCSQGGSSCSVFYLVAFLNFVLFFSPWLTTIEQRDKCFREAIHFHNSWVTFQKFELLSMLFCNAHQYISRSLIFTKDQICNVSFVLTIFKWFFLS